MTAATAAHEDQVESLLSHLGESDRFIVCAEFALNITPTREGVYRLRDSQFSGTWFAANQSNVVVESDEAHRAWLEQAARAPLQPGLTLAVSEYAARQLRSNSGWATVPPAPPPQVNVPGSANQPHDA